MTPAVQAAERQLAYRSAVFEGSPERPEPAVGPRRADPAANRRDPGHHSDRSHDPARRSDGAEATYRLDGSEFRKAGPAGTVTARAKWDGERLVIEETATAADGMTMRTRRVWSLDQQGQLIVESGEGSTRQVATYRKTVTLLSLNGDRLKMETHDVIPGEGKESAMEEWFTRAK
jgi:hypothetical protein